MVEQPDTGEGHDHAVLVGGFDDLVVPDGAAGLGDILHPRLSGPFHVVAEGEEGVRAQGDAGEALGDPLLLDGGRQVLGAGLEKLLPDAAPGEGRKVRDVLIDGVVPLRTAQRVQEVQFQDPGVLPQPPDVRLVPRQPGARSEERRVGKECL